MTPDVMDFLRRMLVQDEGLRLKPYKDTVGKTSIGIGRNLDDVGISESEAHYLLENDIERTVKALVKALPWFTQVDPVRQIVLVNLTFNMGIGNAQRGLLSFKNTLALIQAGRYPEAADALRHSKWYTQVGRIRSERLIWMMKHGLIPHDDTRA